MSRSALAVVALGAKAFALLLLIHPAAAQTVRIMSTPGFNFADFKTYSWRVHPVFEKKPELAETYSVGIQMVMNAVNKNLLGRGYHSTHDNPDFFITFMVTGTAEQDVDVIYSGGYYGWGGWYGWPAFYYPSWTQTVVSNYVEGTLILDFVDAKTNMLAWRAASRDDVRDWKERHKNVQKMVDKALKRFPPK